MARPTFEAGVRRPPVAPIQGRESKYRELFAAIAATEGTDTAVKVPYGAGGRADVEGLHHAMQTRFRRRDRSVHAHWDDEGKALYLWIAGPLQRHRRRRAAPA